MRSLLQTVLAFASLGMIQLGCNKADSPPPAPADVTLNVPGMN